MSVEVRSQTRRVSPVRAGRAVVREHHAALALLLYVAVALASQPHVVAHLDSVCACNSDDATQFMWSMVWWPYALLHGINPFVTHAIWAPHAVNVAAQTTTPGPALIAAPLTAIAGPFVSYNVVNLLAPVIGAWSAYRLCLYLTRSPLASILGGYLYGFSTYAFGVLQGHTHLAFTFAAPALVLLTLKRLDGVICVRRYVVSAAAVVIAQILCGTEMMLTLSVMGAVALLAAWIFSSSEERRMIVRLLPAIAGAYLLAGIVCSPFIYYAVTGPAIAVGRGALFPADALSFAIPPAIIRIGGHRFAAISGAFAGNTSENGTYLGLPLIIIVAAFLVQRWRARAAKILFSVLAVAVLWSLGETLNIVGRPTIPLPWRPLAKLPGLNEVLPVRIGVYIWLACAVMAALWLAVPGSSARRRWTLALLAVVFLIPNVNAKTPGGDVSVFSDRFPDPTFFTTSLYRHYLRPNEVVLPIPYGPSGPSLLWQAHAHMYFRLASGDFYVPLDYWQDPVVQELIGNSPYTAPAAQLRQFLRAHDVSTIVLEAGQPGPWPGVIGQLGLHQIKVGGVLLYHVATALHA